MGLIEALVEANQQQAETLQRLHDEIVALKGEKPKPRFKPSGMENQTDPDAMGAGTGEPSTALPPGSRFI